MVYKLVNITQSFKESVTVQYAFLWASGRQTQGPPQAAHTLATPLVKPPTESFLATVLVQNLRSFCATVSLRSIRRSLKK